MKTQDLVNFLNTSSLEFAEKMGLCMAAFFQISDENKVPNEVILEAIEGITKMFKIGLQANKEILYIMEKYKK